MMNQKNPWISVWLTPRATIRSIVMENPKRSLLWLSAIFGFSELMNFFQSMTLGLWLNATQLLILALIFSLPVGYGLITLWSWLVMHIGHWLKGKGDFASVRVAYAWSSVPLIGVIPIWILIVFYFQERLFLNFPQEPMLGLFGSSLLLLLLAGRLVCIIWALILYFIGLSEVHRFSVFRAICTVAIAGVFVSFISGLLCFALLMLLTAPKGL